MRRLALLVALVGCRDTHVTVEPMRGATSGVIVDTNNGDVTVRINSPSCPYTPALTREVWIPVYIPTPFPYRSVQLAEKPIP